MTETNGLYLTIRKGVWHYLRRVPNDYAHLDSRDSIKVSLKIKVAKDPKGTKARQAAAIFNEGVEAGWRAKVQDITANIQQIHADAIKIARSRGLDYLSAAAVAAQPKDRYVTRIETAMAERSDAGVRTAVLGGVNQPVVMLSELFDEFKKTDAMRQAQMSPKQATKWAATKRRSVDRFIKLIGDKPIQHVTRDDVLKYQEWWVNRAVAEKLSAQTVNKNIGGLNTMIKAVMRQKRIKMDNVFEDARIKQGKDESRVAFNIDYLRDVILPKLDRLEPEARDIVYVLMETGARHAEIVNLTKDRIVLDGPIPRIKIAAENRLLKTDHSKREIPLVGLALEAMRRNPNGFPRYYDNSDDLSDRVMKFLHEEKLLPSEDHKLYSLRHTFKDRLRTTTARDEEMDNLMGHKNKNPKYGDIAIERKADLLQQIAF